LHLLTLLEKERTVSDLIRETRLPQTCVSHCLATLSKERLVRVRKEGKFRKYQRSATIIEPLMKTIDLHLKGGTL